MNFKKIAIVSVAVNLVGFLFFAGMKIIHRPPPPMKDSRTEYCDKWNTARTGVFEHLSIDSLDIIFVGNSITEGFPLQETFGTLHVKNRGISGNQSRHILGRIQEITVGHPKKIFFDIGINDLIDGVPLDSILMHYDSIIDLVHDMSSTTEIYIQSVFPVGPEYKDIAASIPAFNTMLRIMCKSRKITYVDLYYKLLKGDYLDAAYTFDGLHLTGPGYQIWKSAIMPFL